MGVYCNEAALAAFGFTGNCEDVEMNDLSIEILARCFMYRSLVLDSMGLTSHAAAIAALGVDRCNSRNTISEGHEKEPKDVLALRELSIQLQHFSQVLYAGLLNPDSTFIGDWLANTISKNITSILQTWVSTTSDGNTTSATASVLDILVKYVRPMSEDSLCLFQSCSHEDLLGCLISSLQPELNTGEVSSYNSNSISDCLRKSLLKHQAHGTDIILTKLLDKMQNSYSNSGAIVRGAVEELVEDAFERTIVTALGDIVHDSKGSLKGLKIVATVATASMHTISKSERCLRSPMRLASLVATACSSFDNTYSSPTGVTPMDLSREFIPLMWELILCTPTSLDDFDIAGMAKESVVLTGQLDAIQAALEVSEKVQVYMAPPPLFLLLGDQRKKNSCSNLKRCDSSYIRQARRSYIRDLLTGCGFLIAGLGENFVGPRTPQENRNEEPSAIVSSSTEVLCNMVSMGQALILRLCFEFVRSQDHYIDSYGNNDDWIKAAQDVQDLCTYFEESSVPLEWAGHAFLQCIMHFKGVDEDFLSIIRTIMSSESDGKVDDYDEDYSRLGEKIMELGVESVHLERLVLKRAVEIFNSLPSCESDDLREVAQLLSLLPEQPLCPSVACGVRTERALMDLVGLLSTLQVDLLPLQLRLLTPTDIAARLLTHRPQAYYEVNGNEDFEDMNYNNTKEEGTDDRQHLLLRRSVLRERPPPGARLVRVLTALHPITATAAALRNSKAEIRLELLLAAISLGDLEGSYCLCRVLLLASAAPSSEGEGGQGAVEPLVSAGVLQRISESALLVVGMLDCQDPTHADLHHVLRCDLLSLILASSPVSELERFSSLWRHQPSMPSIESSSGDRLEGDEDEEDEANLSAARLALLDMIARMLRRSDGNGSFSSSYLLSPLEMVASAGVDSSRLSDAIGLLLLVKDSDKVHALIEKLYADLDKKLSATLMREKQGQVRSLRNCNKLDEALVARVESKGFSRNSAKRAVLATMGEGFKEALSWAVEHSRDEDFEFPITETVKGALLSENEDDQSSLHPESMKGALKVLADVSEMYQKHRTASVELFSMEDVYPTEGEGEVTWSGEISPVAPFSMDDVYPVAGEGEVKWSGVVERPVSERRDQEGVPSLERVESAEAHSPIDTEKRAFLSPAHPVNPLYILPASPVIQQYRKGKLLPLKQDGTDYTSDQLSSSSDVSAPSTPAARSGLGPKTLIQVLEAAVFPVFAESETGVATVEAVDLKIEIVDVQAHEEEEVDAEVEIEVEVKVEENNEEPLSALEPVVEIVVPQLKILPATPVLTQESPEDLLQPSDDGEASMSGAEPPPTIVESSTAADIVVQSPPPLPSTPLSPPIQAPPLPSVVITPTTLPILQPPPMSLSHIPVVVAPTVTALPPASIASSTPPHQAVPTPPPRDVPAPTAQSQKASITSSNNTVLKAHLVSRLRGALDVAEDFTGIGVHAADLARSVANREASEEGEEEIGGACDQVFQVCRSLATHRRTAAFEFLPQLLSVLPVFFLTDVSLRAERLVFGNTSASISPTGGELERAKWGMAALRLLVYHTGVEPQNYTVCLPTLYSAPSSYRTVLLLAHLYRGVAGSNIEALMGVKKVAADQLAVLLAVDPVTAAPLCAAMHISEMMLAIEDVTAQSTPIFFPFAPSGSSRCTAGSGHTDTAACVAAATAAFKLLQEDIAVLRRVNRIPDSAGISAKSLLKLRSDDLYCVDRKEPSSQKDDSEQKRMFRRQALLAIGPYLYPQTITHWVRVIGRQLGLGSADFSFQYACCTLSATAAKSSAFSGDRGGEGEESWALLANELSSCVKRMKPEHTHALCLIVGGIALPGAAWHSGCEMLFPLQPVPDRGVLTLLTAVHTAVQKQAQSGVQGTTSANSASSAALFSLTATQAGTLLPSITAIMQYLEAVHCLPPSSPFRYTLLKSCWDIGESMEGVFVSTLCSASGAADSVTRLLTACCELNNVEASSGVGGAISTVSATVESVCAKSVASVSDLIVAVGSEKGSEGSLTALAAVKSLLLNGYSNFGSEVTERIARDLYALLTDRSSCGSSVVCGASDAEDEEGRGVSPLGLLDCCLALNNICNSFLSHIGESSENTGLCELSGTVGVLTYELLMTRRCVCQLVSLVEADYWSDSPAPALSSIEVVLDSAGCVSDDTVTYYSLSSRTDREALFSRLAALASDAPPLQVASAVRAIIHVLRLWGMSKAGGSLQKALETGTAPFPLPASLGGVNEVTGGVTVSPPFPAWMTPSFQASAWGRIMDLSERGGLFIDIVEMLIVDIDMHCASGVSGGHSSRVIGDRVTSLISNPEVPATMKHTFGLLAGGDLAKQAARDLERDLQTLPSTSFSTSLFVLLLCLSEGGMGMVQIIARSSVLLARLVRFTSKCTEARLLRSCQTSPDTPADPFRDAAALSGTSTLSEFMESFPDQSDSLKSPTIVSSEKAHSSSSSGGSRSGSTRGCEVLPLVLSPLHLAALLLTGGFFSQAAHIYWTAVMRRPTGLYTAEAASSLLFAHLSQAALPLYLSTSNSPKEVLDSTWGWARWGYLCRLSICKHN